MFKGPGYYWESVKLGGYRVSSGIQQTAAKTALRGVTGGATAKFGHAMGTSLQEGTTFFAAGANAAGLAAMTAFSFVGGLGISVLFERFMNKKEMQVRQRQLLEMYRPQIAAACGVPAKEATMEHLAAVSESVPFFNKVLYEMERDRIIQNRIALGSNVTSFALVVGAAIALPFLGVAGLGAAAILGVAGLATYYSSKAVYTKAVNAVFDRPEIDLETKMHGISKLRQYGRPLPHDLVMQVMAEANPDLGADIRQEFGRSYARLKDEQRVQAMQQFGEKYHLGMVHHGLSTGKIPVYELPFVANGTLSGATAVPFYKEYWDSAKERVGASRERVAEAGRAVADKFRKKDGEEELRSPEIDLEKRPSVGTFSEKRNAEVNRTSSQQPYYSSVG